MVGWPRTGAGGDHHGAVALLGDGDLAQVDDGVDRSGGEEGGLAARQHVGENRVSSSTSTTTSSSAVAAWSSSRRPAPSAPWRRRFVWSDPKGWPRPVEQAPRSRASGEAGDDDQDGQAELDRIVEEDGGHGAREDLTGRRGRQRTGRIPLGVASSSFSALTCSSCKAVSTASMIFCMSSSRNCGPGTGCRRR